MAEPCYGRAREVPEDVEARPLMALFCRTRACLITTAIEGEADSTPTTLRQQNLNPEQTISFRHFAGPDAVRNFHLLGYP